MLYKHLAVAAPLLFAAAMPGWAATVNLSNLTAAWTNPTPAGSVSSNTGAGTTTPQIRWEASGFDFIAGSGGSITVPPSPSATFTLGTFVHVNFPTAVALDTVDLAITADVAVDGVDQGSKTFVFGFTQIGTLNADDPCPFGGANGQGVNINGCADKVLVDFSESSDSFLVGTDIYTLNILGFELGNSFVTEFLTAESAANRAGLRAQVTLRSDLQVPEPMSSTLVGLALLAAAGLGRGGAGRSTRRAA